MPRAQWGITSADVDDFDRDSQYAPYTGQIPPNAVYQWKIKTAKFVSASREKLPSLWVGLELVPRTKDEKRYKGYFIMCFLAVSEKTAFKYVPFLDAIGVNGRDFKQRTIVDEEGKIQKIGPWRNDGSFLIAAQLNDGSDQNGNSRKEISWFGALTDVVPVDDDDIEDVDEFDDSDADYVDDVDEETDDEVVSRAERRRRNTTARAHPMPARPAVLGRAKRTPAYDEEEGF